ncbi:MAG: hypothetical protein L0216_08120 [Planctomycetales bacterium]|nr:hypothetical protein [Planctomycetales bacterium]
MHTRTALVAAALVSLAAPALAQDDALEREIRERVRGERILSKATSPPESEQPRVEGDRAVCPHDGEALRVFFLRSGGEDEPRTAALFCAKERAFWTFAWKRGEGAYRVVNGPFSLAREKEVTREEVEKKLRSLIPAEGSPGYYEGMYAEMGTLGRGVVKHLIAIVRDGGADFLPSMATRALGEIAKPGDVPAIRQLAEDLRGDPLYMELSFSLARLGHREVADEILNNLNAEIRGRARLNPEEPGLGGLYSMRAMVHFQLGQREKAIADYKEAIARDAGNRGIHSYNLACAHALMGESDKALDALEESVKAGYTEFEWMKRDGDLRSLRGHPRFQALVQGKKKKDY